RRPPSPPAAATTHSHRKRFAAAASVLGARVIEPEYLVEPITAEIHGGAGQHRHMLVGDQQARVLAAENMVIGADFVGIVHGVHVTAAAGLAYAHAQPQTAAALGQLLADACDGGV